MWDLIVSVPDHCLSFYFAIPWCIQCICYQTRAKLFKDRNVKVRVDQ